MKFLKYAALAAMALGALTACNKDNLANNNEPKGNTFTAITLSLPGQTRADDAEDYNKVGKWAGNDKINSLDIYVEDGTNVTRYEFKPGEFKVNGDKITTDAFKVSPATNATVYAVVNMTAAVKTKLGILANGGTATKDTFKDAWASNVENTNIGTQNGDKDVVLMTGKSASAAAIEDGVSRDVANQHTKNFFQVNVQRAAARVITTFKEATSGGKTMDVMVGSTKIGTMKDIKWTTLQYDKNFYISPKAGSGTKPALYESFAYSKDATWAAGARADFATYYDYSQSADLKNVSAFLRTGASPALTTDEIKTLAGFEPFFIAETTHAEDQYRKGNTAYVLVQGTFVPEAAICANGVPTEGQDFWYGYDGKVYKADADAKNANGDNRYVKYTGGKAYYIAFINPDPTVKISPVYRNNFYHVHITAFNGLGFSGDPLDPNSPNKPNPNDPNTPGKPGEELKNPKTYMAVECTVLQWNMHSYDATLDPND